MPRLPHFEARGITVTASRIFLLTVFIFLTLASVADSGDSTSYDCLKRLETDERIGDSLIVYTTDQRELVGERPIVNFTSSILYMKLSSPDGQWEDITVPFESLDRITYRKHGHARRGLTLLGFGLGAVVGGAIGVALAPEPEGWLDMPEVQTGAIGAMIGGIFGAVGGNMIGSRMTVQVTLKCW